MARRHYLITYDVSDDRRRNQIFQVLLDQGDHTQYSVFLCQLNDGELAALKSRLVPLTNHQEDQILIVDLGRVDASTCVAIESIGKAFSPVIRTMII